MASQAWNVWLDGKLIDTVFFDDDCDRAYVYYSLTHHDHYNMAIRVIRTNKYQS